MNRKKAIKYIAGISAGSALLGSLGYRFFKGKNENIKDIKFFQSLLAELVEVIIPKTDTPGAKSAGVHRYIIDIYENCLTVRDKENFINGLNELHNTAVNKFGEQFQDCKKHEKDDLVAGLLNESLDSGILLKIKNKLLGKSFKQILYSLTIEGYCNSSIGATRVLEYVQVPGKYIAKKIGRAHV